MNKFEVYLESGENIIDPNFESYNPGTQGMLLILEEQEHEFESWVDYICLVNDLEECTSEEDVKDVIYNYGSHYVNKMKIQEKWMDIMYPRVTKSPYLTYFGDKVVS